MTNKFEVLGLPFKLQILTIKHFSSNLQNSFVEIIWTKVDLLKMNQIKDVVKHVILDPISLTSLLTKL